MKIVQVESLLQTLSRFFARMGMIVSLSVYAGDPGRGATGLPFWKAKDKIRARLEEGEVIVSVRKAESGRAEFDATAASSPAFKHRLRIEGGGLAKAPCIFIHDYAQNFDQVARLSGFIDKADYHKDTQKLDASLSAFGHRADLVIQVRTASPAQASDSVLWIEFTLIKGPLKGLHARLDFVPLVQGGDRSGQKSTARPSATKCEVGIDGGYSYDEFPIPRFFLEFGLEVVFQKMAVKLRGHAEEAYRESSAASAGGSR